MGEGPSDEIISPVPVLQRLMTGAMVDAAADRLARLLPADTGVTRQPGRGAIDLDLENHQPARREPILIDGRWVGWGEVQERTIRRRVRLPLGR